MKKQMYCIKCHKRTDHTEHGFEAHNLRLTCDECNYETRYLIP